jgi:hypothetical protein
LWWPVLISGLFPLESIKLIQNTARPRISLRIHHTADG